MAEKDGGASKQPRNDDDRPVLVAMGASAGGLRALQTFFAALPNDTGAAFVVVMHLDPERHSQLPELLAARTGMSVVSVERRMKLEPDHVYVIPPDRSLRIVDHEIESIAFEEPHGKRLPIDSFFRSVSERLGDGFAVILSGANSDGALGARAVKETGGIILVQDPAEADHSTMPRSAIATGVVDFVLPVRELSLRLADLIKLKQSGPFAGGPKVDEELVRRIMAHLRIRTGHDFSKYKRSTVLRRIVRRMQVTRSDDLKSYYDYMRENSEESSALLADLLISVTTFFRDAEAFEALRKSVLPQLFEANSGDPIRIWVAGCASGEEAYSIAMLLLEEASRHELRPPIQIFGSDLDARALTTAREGRYPAAIEADVNEERLRRFFVNEGDGYRVRQELRDVVLFAVHDLLKDPPFSRVDLISCRNVMIYLDRELQEQVCGTFHYALNPGGFLFLGSSETAENPPGLFRSVDRSARIYQSTAHAGEKPRLLPRLLGPVRIREQLGQLTRSLTPSAALSDAAMHRRAIERVAPPSILVDDGHRVIHLSDHAGRYLLPSGGPLSGDVVDLVRPELRFELRSALNRLFEQHLPTLSLPVHVRFNGSTKRVLLQVKSTEEGDEEHRSAIVMFVEGDEVEESTAAVDQHSTNETVRRLTQELELTQARLRTVREESDAANEELRAANEELQSINEEYRSTSEELETSKEELQSINEELQTVNSELKLKLEAISRAHSDLQNLMAATDFGTLFLDSTLRIKRFTERVTELFAIKPADEGRPITDFAHQLQYDDLIRDARAVLSDLAPVRREIHSRAGQWYDVRIRPYRTVDDKIDGVVITFVDVTERRNVEEALRESEQRLRQQKQLVDLSRDPIFVWDFDGGILDWNRGCEVLYGYSRAEALGKRKEQLLKTVVPGASFDELRARLLRDGNWSGELQQTVKDGRQITVESIIQLEIMDGRRFVLESTRDISERKSWDERQEMLLKELKHRVKNILTVVGAVASQASREAESTEEFLDAFRGGLTALSSAHDLLVQSDWEGADLEALARRQLEPYVSKSKDRLTVRGEPVLLPPVLATPFSLVLHELAVNAVKYGALSVAKGRIEVGWTVTSRARDGANHLSLVWRESGGPVVGDVEKVGAGSALLNQAIPGATVKRAFEKTGLVCTVEVNLQNAK